MGENRWWGVKGEFCERGRPSADGGRRTADSGQRTADGGRRTADSGQRTAVGGPRTRRSADRPPQACGGRSSSSCTPAAAVILAREGYVESAVVREGAATSGIGACDAAGSAE